MTKRDMKIIFIILLAAPILILFGWKLFVHEYYMVSINSKGRALAAAVNLAFGQEPYLEAELKDFHPYAHLVAPLKNHCAIKLENSPKCLLASPYADGQKIYHRRCAWWRFDACPYLMIDPVFQKNEELFSAANRVLEQPCMFLPTEQEIAQFDAPKRFLNEYRQYRRDLDCEGGVHKEDLFVGLMKQHSSNYFVIQMQTGGK